MSFILDPPALFLLGILMYYVGKRFNWSEMITVLVLTGWAFIAFMVGSTLLYMDVIDWPLPPTEGPVWMFHTNFTGIAKADVPVWFALFNLFLYPVWIILGFTIAQRRDEGFFLGETVTFEDVKSSKAIDRSLFSVKRGDSPRELVRQAIGEIGGIGAYVKSGNKVLIKPNICGGNPEILGTFTDKNIVDEIVKMVREQGAEPIIADSDMIWTRFQPVAEAQGWPQWAEEANVPLVNLGDTEWVRFDFGKGSAIGKVPVSRELVDADVIISIPVMKTHLLTNITIAMKNMYGTFPEENKAKYHRFGIERVVYEVCKAFTPNLTIIDGTVGGEGTGPLSSDPVNSGTIIASNDVVAADAIACTIMGYDPFEVAHIRIADKEGLGDANIEFELSQLTPEHPKDGKWIKPEPLVTLFYETLCELVLLLPSMQIVFDLASDFVLYDTSTLPIFRETTPMILNVLNSVLGSLFRTGYRGIKWTQENLEEFKKRVF
ncbi:MAG: DUF362 domain-containing protein [Candidatus Thorarchaeota archaeon]